MLHVTLVAPASTSNGFAPASRFRIARSAILCVSVRVDIGDHPSSVRSARGCGSKVRPHRASRSDSWWLATLRGPEGVVPQVEHAAIEEPAAVARRATWARISRTALFSVIPRMSMARVAKRATVVRHPRSRQGSGAHRDSRQNQYILLILLVKLWRES